MSVNADNLRSAVRYALETTRGTTVCPFHPDVMIRVGDDAAEKHAYARAKKIIKSDGTMWEREVLMEEFKRLLADAADGVCPQCAAHSALSGAQALQTNRGPRSDSRTSSGHGSALIAMKWLHL